MAEHDQEEFDGWISTARAAAILGLTQRRIRQLINESTLRGRLIAGRWFVKSEDVYAYKTRDERSD